ncbi:MAG: N-acetylmuramic acid 6-phosphate etherase [Cyclobacteriaceae bacterium]
MAEKPTTESTSLYDHLEKMTVSEILTNINKEDQKVAVAVNAAIPAIEKLVTAILPGMLDGGRLFYIGSGTSGRLGIVDASECPPTFGVSDDLVIGLISGGDRAIRKAVEFAEDDPDQGWKDILKYNPDANDCLIGIAASGRTPYVIGALKTANEKNMLTGCITCNAGSELARVAQFPVEVVVGPEFVTGSTRMKAGTAQKLVLNMISTSLMIRMGRVKGNKMVDMQLTNEKLMERGIAMIREELGFSQEEAKAQLLKYGTVREVVENCRP